MKKIISLIVCSVLLAGLVAPAVAGAQETLKECCTLGSAVSLKSGDVEQECGAGQAVGPNAEAAGECNTTVCSFVPAAADGSMSNWGMYCLLNTINNVTNWLFYLLLIAVVLMGVIGGVLYMTSAGNSEKAEKGKNVIIYAIVGLVLALIARLIPSVVRLIVGM